MTDYTETKWTYRTIDAMFANDEINFDHEVQRGFVWDTKTRSILVASILEKCPPIPPIVVNKVGKVYYVLDGKQRALSIIQFIRDKYRLSQIDKIEYINQYRKTEIKDISKLKFSEMSDDMKDQILNSALNVYVYNDLSQKEIIKIFTRWNNGKPLRSIEKTRVVAQSLSVIKELGEHDLFLNNLTAAARKSYVNENLVIRAWGILYLEEPDFNRDKIEPKLKENEITPQQTDELILIFDNILKIISYLKTFLGGVKASKNIISMLMKPSHFYNVCAIVKKAIELNEEMSSTAEFFLEFFTKAPETDDELDYRKTSWGGSGKASVVRDRVKIITKSYDEFLKSKSTGGEAK